MCGIVGIVNKKGHNTSLNELKIMTNSLIHRGPDEEGFYIKNELAFGHRRLVVVDKEFGKQPYEYDNLVMIYNGELYNTEELRNNLKQHGYTFDGYSDTEVLIKGYHYYKEGILEKINGIFAFAIWDGERLFLARDQLGVKPLFYKLHQGGIIFGSEIKAILAHNEVKGIVSVDSLRQILALGPSRIPGSGVYENICEIENGHYLIYDGSVKIKKYWDVSPACHVDDYEATREKVKYLLTDSIRRQLVSDVPLCTFLSGGVDSSIITSVAKKEKKDLNTYSIEYQDNSKFFVGNNYQVAQDRKYIDIMTKTYDIEHNYEVISQEELFNELEQSLVLKDMPGMADIDSSLYWFSKQIKDKHTVGLSGECADEIFGGYPWFYRDELLNIDGFPWIRHIDTRESILNDKWKSKLNLKHHLNEYYKASIENMSYGEFDSKSDRLRRRLTYLNMKWFMATLLERKDRMTMGASLEVRVPFADVRLVEYLYNVPWEYKYKPGIEKSLLREAMDEWLPTEVLERKKNPYPKTFNPRYGELVSDGLKHCLEKENSVLKELFDIKKLNELIDTKGESINTPWFGQLMTGPQLLAYLYQFHKWFEIYGLEILL